MSKLPKKIIFAAGGSGGHLFPAQALAEKLLKLKPDTVILFAAAKLNESPYFDKAAFDHRDIQSTTPFRGGPLKVLKSVRTLLKGIRESMQLLRREQPDLVIGFGSFHSFPVLCAAALKKIPIVLFESNSIPGKVIRLFSKRALFTATFFPEAKRHLKGDVCEVEIPKKMMHDRPPMSKADARRLFHLDPDRTTLLIFGGSQGAKNLNKHFQDLIPLFHEKNLPIQCIHFTGNKETAAALSTLYQSLNIPSYVRDFEPRMDIAWSAADLAVCRAGAMTLSELLHYEVPAILIPYPYAADQHQLHNARIFEKEIGCVNHFTEDTLSADLLCEALMQFVDTAPEKRKAIASFKAQQKKADLSSLIIEILERP